MTFIEEEITEADLLTCLPAPQVKRRGRRVRAWKMRRTQICEFARYSDVVSRENITTAAAAAARKIVTAVLQMARLFFQRSAAAAAAYSRSSAPNRPPSGTRYSRRFLLFTPSGIFFSEIFPF